MVTNGEVGNDRVRASRCRPIEGFLDVESVSVPFPTTVHLERRIPDGAYQALEVNRDRCDIDCINIDFRPIQLLPTEHGIDLP